MIKEMNTVPCQLSNVACDGEEAASGSHLGRSKELMEIRHVRLLEPQVSRRWEVMTQASLLHSGLYFFVRQRKKVKYR